MFFQMSNEGRAAAFALNINTSFIIQLRLTERVSACTLPSFSSWSVSPMHILHVLLYLSGNPDPLHYFHLVFCLFEHVGDRNIVDLPNSGLTTYKNNYFKF